MKSRPYIPLVAKVLGWLLLHLLLLSVAFVAFVAWQLGLGLDSLLSGSAGDRLRDFGETARSQVMGRPPAEWNGTLQALGDRKNVKVAFFDPIFPKSFPSAIPRNVLERIKKLPQPRQGPPEGRPPPMGLEDMPPDENALSPSRPRPDRPLPQEAVTPLFLMRGEGGDGYWAGIHLRMAPEGGMRPPLRPRLLLIRAEHLDGSGMFFEFKPWLWGGLAVLGLSLAFWTPFVLGITRYLHRLKLATEGISSGQFQVALPYRGKDELSSLGDSIETMAKRLDHLISGQKRFLGDAAHELCAPLVRIRTGLGILEMKLSGECAPQLASIEADAAELAALVEEILAFSRAGNRRPNLLPVNLKDILHQAIAREGGSLEIQLQIPDGLVVQADAALLGRAVGNLLRNASIHAGVTAHVTLVATEEEEHCTLTVADDGPGVAEHELARLFEPFYRPDRSRSRETGGSGLGLAIVRTAIEACQGEVSAHLPASGGFSVTIRLLKSPC